MATTKKSAGKRTVGKTKPAKATTTAKKTAVARKATAKRSTTQAASSKRSTVKRKPTAKASTNRKSPARSSRSKVSSPRSFRVSRQDEPFMSLKITVQTLYWLILSGVVLMLGLWVLNIHNKVQTIYDEIDQSTIIQRELDQKELQMLREKADKDQRKNS